MAMSGAVLLLWGIILEQSLASGGSEMEHCVPSLINDGVSWWHGAAEARKRVRVILCVHEEETFGTMGASMASLVRGFTSV
jgi:hypothetical protein